MGTVHAVSLKYLVLSTSAGFIGHQLAPKSAVQVDSLHGMLLVIILPLYLAFWHISLVNAMVFVLFNLRRGMLVLGKDPDTGEIPMWSYCVFPGFHIPTWLYTRIQHSRDQAKGVAVADEVECGWWVGGRYGVELGRKWSGIVDLTCEFPEGCASSTEQYLLLPCWDGVPPPPELLEKAASFAVEARHHGDVMVHCAHGRGRSTTVLCACLVKAGLYTDWEAAFEAIRQKRKVVKLNRSMRSVLDKWQAQFMEKGK